MNERWLREPIRNDVVDLWRLDEVLHESWTPFQHVMVARTALGTTLFCDDNPQSAEVGQWHFHEAELIPAMLLSQRTDRVLVIGCSEGTVSQIAVLAGATRVDHVDIDPDCVRICAQHLPYGFDLGEVARAERGDGRIRLHYDDGARFVSDALGTGDRYDLVVLDLPEEQEGSDAGHNTFYTYDFLLQCRRLLTPGGVVSTHVSRPYLSLPSAETAETFQRPWQRFGEAFGTRVYFRSDEQPWAAVMLGQVETVANPVERMLKRLGELAYAPRTIDELALVRATQLPNVLRNA